MNNKKPLISIIVPVYKVERYIRKCIESIINQTYKNIEIILIDDGSPDNCPEIVDYYSTKDARIKVIHKQNGGLSDARNVGINEAVGDYIGFVDSDDYIEPEMFEYLYNLIIENDADISTCPFMYRGFAGKVKKPSKTLVLDRIEAIKMLIDDNIVQNYAWNKLYKKELFIDNNIRYPFGKVMEDVATTYLLFNKSKRIVIGDKPMYNYLIRPNSIMTTQHSKRDILYVENLLERTKFFIKDDDIKQYCYNRLFQRVFKLYLKNDKELRKWLYDNNMFKQCLDLGLENNLIEGLSRKDKTRIKLFKFNPRLYELIIQTIRKIVAFKNSLKNNHDKEIIKELLNEIDTSSQNKVYIFLSADYGNMGDVAITYAQKLFLKDVFPKYKIIEVRHWLFGKMLNKVLKRVKKEDIVTIVGGGNLGNLYDTIEDKREFVIKKLRNKTICQFPQTISINEDDKISKDKFFDFYKNHKNVEVHVREKMSFDIVNSNFLSVNTYLTPDIVFYLRTKIKINKCKTNHKIGICLRDDIECVSDDIKAKFLMQFNKIDVEYFDTHIGDDIFIYEKREKQLMDLISEISSYKMIVTDRLHAMIFCYLTQTPCMVFDNSTHKIKSTYETWLKDCKFITLIENSNVSFKDFLENVTFSDVDFKSKFEHLKESCENNESKF